VTRLKHGDTSRDDNFACLGVLKLQARPLLCIELQKSYNIIMLRSTAS